MRLAFFGTPVFSIPTLERLLRGRHPVVLIVSQPDRPRGRGRTRSASPVAEVALREGIALLRPESVGELEVVDALRRARVDLGVVVAFGQFLPKSVREAPSLGYLINGHASLLPRFRGAAPIERAILAGERATGVSVMRVEREMDAGAVALAREIEIGTDETAGALAARLADLAAEAIAETVDRIAEGRVAWNPQDPTQATFAPKIERDDACLDWSDSASALARRIRAMAPTPGAFTKQGDDVVRILAARAEPGPTDRPPGRVRCAPNTPLRVATGDGWLVPLRIQRPGARVLDVEDYLRGRPIPDGAPLGEAR
ncbi:MAG: methionyl-tRNA formyltransferase [Myxococcales bacterium]|nr:methionyl-tRNA formyltransferase [Myxococcales bacterium]